MTITEQIKVHIKHYPKAKPFTASSLYHLASADTVRKILGRLVKSGEIERLARGVFAKPKSTRYGKALPSTLETVQAIAKANGETLAIHGAEAARRLQLSTQMPLQLVLYTSGNSRKINVGSYTVTLQHINPCKMVAPNTTPGLVISALWYLGQQQVSIATIHKIVKTIPPHEFKQVLSYVGQMPAWMAHCFYQYNQQQVPPL